MISLTYILFLFIQCKIIKKQNAKPERLNGPYTTLVRRSGNSFELATLLASLLIGNYYDAYIVVGYADRDTTMNIRVRIECPDLPEEARIKEEVIPKKKKRLPDERSVTSLESLIRKAQKLGLKVGPDGVEEEEEVVEENQEEEEEVKGEHEEEQKQEGEEDKEGVEKLEEEKTIIEEVKEEEKKEDEAVLEEETKRIEGSDMGEASEGSMKIEVVVPTELDVKAELAAVLADDDDELDEEEVSPQEGEEFVAAEVEEEEIKSEGSEEELEEEMSEQVEEEVEEEEEDICGKFFLKPKPDFRSRFIEKMKARQIRKMIEKHEKALEEKRLRLEEENKAHGDRIEGWRLHAWILILPSRDVEDPIFVEPAEANAYPLNAPQYQSIDCVYNENNYYVNMQDCSVGLDKISYELHNLEYWEHLLSGEPTEARVLPGTDTTDPASAVDTEKHMDICRSWVERLIISPEEFGQRYPGAYKMIRYKRSTTEKFARYYQDDGLVKRVCTYDDNELKIPLMTYEWYENRADLMIRVTKDHKVNTIKEEFARGRNDMLHFHTYSSDASPLSLEAHRIFEYFYYPRSDHLAKVVTTPTSFEETFIDRADKLLSRKVLYDTLKGGKVEFSASKDILKITEKYDRNAEIEAREDVAVRTYDVLNGLIDFTYHYDRNFITHYTRNFVKPDLTLTGGVLLYDPTKTSGYIADVLDKQPLPLELFRRLEKAMVEEATSRKRIRDRESDAKSLLERRRKELTEPELIVNLFDTDRNFKAQDEWRNIISEKAQVEERELEFDYDPLAPYLARLFGKVKYEPLSISQAEMMRFQCLEDFKARQLMIQEKVQEQFDRINDEYKKLKLWYLANQYILTPEKEVKYFEQSAELSFQVHAIEVQLTRNKNLSHERYQTLISLLDKHPMLVAAFAQQPRHRSVGGFQIRDLGY